MNIVEIAALPVRRAPVRAGQPTRADRVMHVDTASRALPSDLPEVSSTPDPAARPRSQGRETEFGSIELGESAPADLTLARRIDSLITAALEALLQSGPLAADLPDLSSSRPRILELLDQRGPLQPGVLARMLDRDPSSVTRASQQLIRAGLLERLSDPADRRKCWLKLTTVGHHAVEQAKTQRYENIRCVLSKIPAWQRAELVRALPILIWVADEIRYHSRRPA